MIYGLFMEPNRFIQFSEGGAFFTVESLFHGNKPCDLPDTIDELTRSVLGLTEDGKIPFHGEKKSFWKIGVIHCGQMSGESLLVGLEKIGKKEGFRAQSYPLDLDWIRDIFYPISEKSWILPAPLSETRLMEIALQWEKVDNQPDSKKSPTHFLGAVASPDLHHRCKILNDLGLHRAKFQVSELYFQGGNILKAENKKGEKCILIGAYNVFASHILLNRSIEKIQELFCQTIPGKGIFPGLKNFEQQSYHLDVSMLPIMGGKILLQDHKISIRLLKRLIENPHVTSLEKEQFQIYLKDAKELDALKGPALSRLKEELQTEGFEVISISGNYYSAGKRNINYLNALHGFGESGNSFVVTYDFDSPGEKYLRAFFTHQLHREGVEHVYYIPSLESKMIQKDGGGLHCDTLEIGK